MTDSRPPIESSSNGEAVGQGVAAFPPAAPLCATVLPLTTDMSAPTGPSEADGSNPSDHPASTKQREGAPHEAQSCLERVKALLQSPARTEGIQDALNGLSQAVQQLIEEHSGMADELLAVYEQLGVVFDVTGRLPSVHTEEQVLELFLTSLSHSFRQCAASLVQPGPSWVPRDQSKTLAAPSPEAEAKPPGAATGNSVDRANRASGARPSAPPWLVRGCRITVSNWLAARIEEARSGRQIVVADTQPMASVSGTSSVCVLVAPIFAGSDFVCTIVLVRTNDMGDFTASDMLVIESLSIFCGDLIRNHRLLARVREISFSTVRALVNAVDQKDPYTSGHSIRVAYFASLLATAVGLTGEDLEMLQWAALLHDVGKIGIRDEVLQKQGRLTKEEFDHIKEHPVRSYRVLLEVPHLSNALAGVRHHHEAYEGGGYPDGLVGEDIPYHARIIQIADVFDALTSTRAYRAAYDWRQALTIMAGEAGTRLDPNLQALFAELIGSLLEDDPDAWERLLEEAERFLREWGSAATESGVSRL